MAVLQKTQKYAISVVGNLKSQASGWDVGRANGSKVYRGRDFKDPCQSFAPDRDHFKVSRYFDGLFLWAGPYCLLGKNYVLANSLPVPLCYCFPAPFFNSYISRILALFSQRRVVDVHGVQSLTDEADQAVKGPN